MMVSMLRLNPQQREEAGIIATLIRVDKNCTIHIQGNRTFALNTIVRLCDRYGWKIVAFSTPETIYRDMQGSREGRIGERSPTGKTKQGVNIPEKTMLSHIGRLDLLHGRIAP